MRSYEVNVAEEWTPLGPEKPRRARELDSMT